MLRKRNVRLYQAVTLTLPPAPRFLCTRVSHSSASPDQRPWLLHERGRRELFPKFASFYRLVLSYLSDMTVCF